MDLPKRKIGLSLSILMAPDLPKYFYPPTVDDVLHVLSDSEVRRVGDQRADPALVFLGSVAAGTIIGGPVGDRIGPQVRHLGLDSRNPAVHVILPYANLFWTASL